MTRKIKLIIVVFIFATFIFSGCVFQAQEIEPEKPTKEGPAISQTEAVATVLHIFDGDTFTARVDGKVETIRAIGIDAPESGHKYTAKECYSEEATKRAIELLGGNDVKLEPDPTQADRDKFNRLLRYVYLPEGEFFNKIMIEEGRAREYTFENIPYAFQSEFLQAQSGRPTKQPRPLGNVPKLTSRK